MSCPESHLDGAYVLGSLPAAERQDFERHLATCEECARAVRELAGLPGLLARVDPSVLEPRTDAPLPDTLLPSLVREVRRGRRRAWLAGLGVAAAAAAVAVAVPLLAGKDQPARVPGAGAPSEATGVVMQTVGDAPVRGTLALRSVPWGTKLDLTCTYRDKGGGPAYRRSGSEPTSYVMVVRTADGRSDTVGTWHEAGGATTQVTGATAAPRDDIVSVLVRTADGRPVLRLRD